MAAYVQPNNPWPSSVVNSMALTLIILDNSTEAPVPVHDAKAIHETLLAQGPDLRLGAGVPRTTNYLQFFANDSRYSSEKPYVLKIPLSQ